MRPLKITAHNVVCYRELELDASQIRNAAIIGPNGSGKSLLTDLIRVALFDTGRAQRRPGSALSKMIGPWGDQAQVSLTFEHRGQLYRVTRTRKRTATGKTTSKTDVLQSVDSTGAFSPCPQDVTDVLGMSGATLGATTFLRFRGIDGLGDFGPADPDARKAILYELRQTGRYKAYAEAAKGKVTEQSAKMTAATAAADEIRRAVERHQAQANAGEALRAQLEPARASVSELEQRLASARVQAAAVRELETTAERALAALRDAEEAERRHRGRVSAVRARIDGLRATLEQADAIRAAAARRAELTTAWTATKEAETDAVAVHGEARAAVAAARREHDRQEAAIRAGEAQNAAAERVGALEIERAEVETAIAELEPEVARGVKVREAAAAAATLLERTRAQNAVAERGRALAAELERVTADVAVLEPLAVAVQTAIRESKAHDADAARAAELAGVPCHGQDAYAGCRFLAEAVAARDRLEPLRQVIGEAVGRVAELAEKYPAVDAGACVVGHDAGPLERVLAELRAKQQRLAGEARGLGTVPELVDVGPLVDAVELARAEVAKLAGDAPAQLEQKRRRRDQVAGELRALGSPARVDVDALRADAAQAFAAIAAAEQAAAARATELEQLRTRLEEIRVEGTTVRALAERLSEVDAATATQAAEQATLAELLADGSTVAAVAAARQEADRTAMALEGAGSTVGLAELERRAAGARTDLARFEAGIATAEAAAETAERARGELARLEADWKVAARRRALASSCARFYVEAPTLIVENDRAGIEREANAWLARTSELQLELVLQRPQVTNTMKVDETLDVDVIRPGGLRSVRETCSAGELFRIDIGLAVAIGRVLGSGQSWLCIDEGFGCLKDDTVVHVCRELEGMLDELDGLWVIEHTQLVIDMFPTRLRIVPGPNGSRVEVE